MLLLANMVDLKYTSFPNILRNKKPIEDARTYVKQYTIQVHIINIHTQRKKVRNYQMLKLENLGIRKSQCWS